MMDRPHTWRGASATPSIGSARMTSATWSSGSAQKFDLARHNKKGARAIS
jgi:hypothetical protein